MTGFAPDRRRMVGLAALTSLGLLISSLGPFSMFFQTNHQCTDWSS